MNIKKILSVIITVFIIGVIVVAAYNIYKDKRVPVIEQSGLSVEVQELVPDTKVAQGEFIKIDTIHKGSGVAEVHVIDEQPVLAFKDFKVTNGPDLFVYLAKDDAIKSSSDLGDYVSLGTLHSDEGEQIYALPANYDDYKSVVIWCRAFGVLFSSAELQ